VASPQRSIGGSIGSCCRLLPENIVHGKRGAIDGASGLARSNGVCAGLARSRYCVTFGQMPIGSIEPRHSHLGPHARFLTLAGRVHVDRRRVVRNVAITTMERRSQRISICDDHLCCSYLGRHARSRRRATKKTLTGRTMGRNRLLACERDSHEAASLVGLWL
jgi:hypothetical protein